MAAAWKQRREHRHDRPWRRRIAAAVTLAIGAAGIALTPSVAAEPGLSAWGTNTYGQLGTGTTTAKRSAVAVPAVGEAAALAAGDAHSLALRADGTLLAWGANTYGQVGDGTTTTRKAPVRVGLTEVAAVAAGQHFTLAARRDGTVWAWGRNAAGQLGDGTTTTRKTPVQVPGLTGVVAVAAADTHALALRGDGTVWAWGANASGQLGDGTTTPRRTPVQVADLGTVLAVAAGGTHSVALRADGTVWTWGANGSGQLGDNTTTARRRAQQVAGVTGATAIAAGDAHTLALREDGTVRAWGRNTSGQLGDNSVTNRRTPVTVTGLAGVRRIAAGDLHSLAVRADGTLATWGYNSSGQLGDGTVTSRRTPVTAKGVSRAGVLAGGSAHTLAAAAVAQSGAAPAAWWAGDADGTEASGGPTAVLGEGVGFATGAVACGFALTARGSAVEIPDAPALEPGTSFTFLTWLTLPDVVGERVVAAKGAAWSLAVADGKLRFSASGDGADVRTVTTTAPVVTAGTWHAVAVVYDGALTESQRAKVYVDGSPVAVAAPAALAGPPAAIADLPAPLRLGGQPGGLDEVRLFADPLTAAAVAEAVAEDVDRAGEPCDITAPATDATLDPVPNAAGWHRGPVEVTLRAADDPAGTGVATLTWSATGAGEVAEETAEAPTATVPVAAEGVTTLTAAATDVAGNTENPREFPVRIDTRPPQVGAQRLPEPNAAGWNSGDVTVTYACTDALSGVATCPAPQTLTGEGADLSRTGTATDVAGNEATAGVTGIRIDRTAPELTGAPLDEAEWHRGDVAVRWTARDELSGVAAAPADGVVTGEGRDLTATAEVVDRAGNRTVATSAPVSIDRTPPVTGASASSGSEGWSRDALTVELAAGDNLSGVARTRWELDGAGVHAGSSVRVEDEGSHVLRYWSEDAAGNVEQARSVEVRVDRTAPTIRPVLTPEANERGWHSTDVTVAFECADDSSGVALCSDPQRVATEGAGQLVEGEATDAAGNRATATATVNVDRTAPAVRATADRAPDADGWYAAPVTVGFACTDGMSGVVTCPDTQVVGEGRDQTVVGTGRDAAGNAAEARLGGLSVDLTPPVLRGTVTSEAGGAGEAGDGWHRGDVTVTWECADALSGVADCPEPTPLTGEGELSATATVRDRAGNATTATVGGIRIDRTAPVTAATAPEPVTAGWHRTAVPVTLTATDALSGVARTLYMLDGGPEREYAGPVTVESPGTHELRFWSIDHAGNTGEVGIVAVRIDGGAPTVRAVVTPEPNAAGWSSEPVTVSFACADAETGVAECPADVRVEQDGAGQKVTGRAVDRAGNTATAEVAVNVDRTPPRVAVAGVVDGATYVLGEPVPVPTCTADDGTGSGLAAPCAVSVSGGGGAGVGTVTVTATAADRAGNRATATASYSVGYRFDGFASPIGTPGHTGADTVGRFKAGSTVPVKFVLRDAAGAVVVPAKAPVWLEPATLQSDGRTLPAPRGTTAIARSGDGYQVQWKTAKEQVGRYWRIGVQLDDGSVHTATVYLW